MPHGLLQQQQMMQEQLRQLQQQAAEAMRAGTTDTRLVQQAGGTDDRLVQQAGGTDDRLVQQAGGTDDRLVQQAGGTNDRLVPPERELSHEKSPAESDQVGSSIKAQSSLSCLTLKHHVIIAKCIHHFCTARRLSVHPLYHIPKHSRPSMPDIVDNKNRNSHVRNTIHSI